MAFLKDILVTLGTIGLIFYLGISIPYGEFNTRYWTQDMRGFWMGATGIGGDYWSYSSNSKICG